MINKPLSFILGMALAITLIPQEAIAYPIRRRISPNSGIHRTIVVPNTRVGGSYDGNRNNFYYRRGPYSRERIRIERDNRGYCVNCDYGSRYHRSRYRRDDRYYRPNGSYYSPRYRNFRYRYNP